MIFVETVIVSWFIFIVWSQLICVTLSVHYNRLENLISNSINRSILEIRTKVWLSHSAILLPSSFVYCVSLSSDENGMGNRRPWRWNSRLHELRYVTNPWWYDDDCCCLLNLSLSVEILKGSAEKDIRLMLKKNLDVKDCLIQWQLPTNSKQNLHVILAWRATVYADGMIIH
jgi:hypothetical protein